MGRGIVLANLFCDFLIIVYFHIFNRVYLMTPKQTCEKETVPSEVALIYFTIF
jgi:hypothetical protein